MHLVYAELCFDMGGIVILLYVSKNTHRYGLAQDCSVLKMDLLQSCAKPPVCSYLPDWHLPNHNLLQTYRMIQYDAGWYNAVNFLQTSHNWDPIACSSRRSMGWLLWVLTLLYGLLHIISYNGVFAPGPSFKIWASTWCHRTPFCHI